jgi:hypothetical protein
MKQLFLVVIVTMASFSTFATEGYSPYLATEYHHKLGDIKGDLDNGCSWKLFCDHHAIGWNRTLLLIAKHFGGGENNDGTGVFFTFNGKEINLAYITGDDFEAILFSSKIISTNLKIVKTSARVTWNPGYEYYSRKIRVVDGVTEKFFAKSLGDYYGDPALASISILHTGDICGNAMEEYLITSQDATNIEEERRPSRQQSQRTTTAEGVVVNNYITNNNNSSSNQTQDQNSTNLNQPGQQGMSTGWSPGGAYYNDQVGDYGYGAPWLSAGVRASFGLADPMLYGGGSCNNQFYDDGCNYDRGYRPRTDNGWGNNPPRNDRGNTRNHNVRQRQVTNYGGPRGNSFNNGGNVTNGGGIRDRTGDGRGHTFNNGDGGASRARSFNNGGGGGARGRR